MAVQLQDRISSWTAATVLNQIVTRMQLLAGTIASYWTKPGTLRRSLITSIKYRVPPSAKWHSQAPSIISTEKGQRGEIILDYGRCEGGLPVFEISSLRSKEYSVQFDVIYSESFKGLENEEGDGPYFLFSNAMNTYRRETYNVNLDKVPIVVQGRHHQQSQRYQKIILNTPNSSVIFSQIGFLPSRSQEPALCSFTCSDEVLNRIYRDGYRTLEMCTLNKGETLEAWDVIDAGTRVFGQHWAPLRQGTRWGDKTVNFEVLVENMGASWGIHMVANGLIFCLDIDKNMVHLFEGLSHLNTIFPTVDRGHWSIEGGLVKESWLSVQIITFGSSVTLKLNDRTIGKLDGLEIRPLLGGSGANTGSIAFGGPAGCTALYRNLLVTDGNSKTLYENDLLLTNKERTMADFGVGSNMLACTIDGAKRDRTTFAGDLYVMARSIYYSTARIDAVLGSLLLLTSHQTTEGYLGNLCPPQAPMHDENDQPPTHAFYSLSYALLLITTIKDYWWHTGDEEFVHRVWHKLDKLLQFTQGFIDERGLVVAPPPLSMDWFPLGGPIFGASSKINIAYYEALTSMAKMDKALNMADTYTDQAAKLKESILAHLWSEDTKVIKMSDNSSQTGISQDINAYAIKTGIIPATITPTTPDSNSLPLAFRNLPSWDSCQIISPYASGFAAEALFLSGNPAGALALIKRVWGIMADVSSENYSGAHWEAMKVDGTPFGHDTSLAHGWSTWPVFLLPMYVAGVRALEPGWRRWCVRPDLVGLESVVVEVEVGKGRVKVALTAEVKVGRGEMRVMVPKGTICEVLPPKGWTFDPEGDACDEFGMIVVEGQDEEVVFGLIVE